MASVKSAVIEIATSAPKSIAIFLFSGLEATAITLHPRIFASCTAIDPVPPAAA